MLLHSLLCEGFTRRLERREHFKSAIFSIDFFELRLVIYISPHPARFHYSLRLVFPFFFLPFEHMVILPEPHVVGQGGSLFFHRP